MNDDSPLTSIGDEPVEARIVAWVLGEASGFEVAELERLCEERPELLVFRRRMLALHGLLAEAHATQADGSWKLVPEKRQTLDELFGKEKPKPVFAELQKERSIRHSGRRAVLAIAACLVLTFVVVGIFSVRKINALAVPSMNFMASRGAESSKSDQVPLTTKLPPESIEGTPRPIRLPGISAGLSPGESTAAAAGNKAGTGTLTPMGGNNFTGGANKKPAALPNKPEAKDRLAKNEKTNPLREMSNLDVVDPAAPPASSAGPSPEAAGVAAKLQQKKLAQITPATKVKRVFAEGAASSYQIPDPDDRFGEMAALSSRSGGGMSGGLGGAGSGMGFGRGAGTLADGDAAGDSQRQPRPRVQPKVPAPPSADTLPAPTTTPAAQPQAAKELAAKVSESLPTLSLSNVRPGIKPQPATPAPAKPGSGTGTGFGGGGRATAADDSLATEPGNDDQVAHGGQSDGIDNQPDRLAGEKNSLAYKQAPTAGDMPVLGTLFARRDKSVMDEQRELNGRDGRDQGKTTVAGGAPSVTGSARFDGKHAGSRENNAVAKADKSDQSVSDRARGEVLSQVEEGWGWGKASLADGKSKDTDAKLKLEYSSDYNFKEKDLGQSKEASASKAQAPQLEIIRELTYPTEYEPPEPPQGNHPSAASAALSKAIQDQENKVEERRKVLATIARTKQAILKDSTQTMMDSTRDSAIKRGLDAQDYGDAQRDFETDHKLLQQMKLKQLETVMSADPGELRKAVKDQESKVEERRKALATIVRTKGIIYKGADSFYDRSGGDEDQGAHDALQTYQKLTQEKMQLEAQINSLLKYDSDQLMVYAGGLDLPDNVVKDVYPKYQEAKRQLEDLKIQGLADAHPAVLAAKDQINTKKRQIDEGVVNLRATLKAQLELADNRLKSVEGMKDSTREEAIKRGLDAQDYVDAKRDFEADQMLLQQMKLKLLEKTDAPLPEPEQPKPDLTKLMEETVATQDPYSTFSLYISDASFQVAQAAFAKGERPDPAGIKVEQFYNAVDYGDPSPTAGEPVAVAIEQAAHPVIPGRNLVRVALKTAAAGRSAAQALRLTLLVDQSGSMVRDDRRAAMDKALAGLAGLLTKNDLVTVVGFARTPRLLADGWTGEQAAKLTELVNQSASEGGTNLEEALKLAEQLAERRKLAGAQNRIVLFTDGAANLGDADPARLAAKVKALRQKGIAFDIAGIAADDLNDELLGELARNGNGRYYVVGKGADENFAHQLAGAFRPAAENVKVQVHFNPERVGRYKLIGFEKDRLKTEDFRNDAVDAAELAAEEAGVAIYQVEPLPGGSGELGDVSVRFRDTASGQMVERTWTIPHDAGAPTLDRATPPMQLAVLALFAAEKLRGGPLAEAIDFKQLAEPRANVKRFYGNTGRVAEVLHMIDSL